jgi:sulfur-carrier protein adenylyltransferase/sulfurtransferase
MSVPFEITVQELKEMRDNGTAHRLIDVREPDEFRTANIGGELMPMNTVPSRLQDLDPDEDIIVHCKMGGRSAQVVEYLRKQGFEKARNLQGGILAWAEKIDKSVKV